MKKIIGNIFFFSVAAVLLASCKKDEVKTVMTQSTGPTLTASSTAINLVQANADNEAVTFNWNTAQFGFSAAPTYTLQLSRKGSNWAPASTSEINLSNNRTRKFTIGELNRELLKFLPAGQANEVDVRVKTEVAASVAPVYSNVITIRATPYRDIINYEFPQALNVAGNFQGWDPATAPKIVDKAATGSTGSSYEGYINFANASPEFKFVKGNNWGAGDIGSAGAGMLGSGGNLSLPEAGVYRVRANTTAMTWSAVKINTWGIIGDATPGDWAASTPMTMNADGTYSITTQLQGGKNLKFRANNNWDINFGDNTANGGPDNVPDYGGDNIVIPTTGTYQVILDLTVAGNYNYTIRRI